MDSAGHKAIEKTVTIVNRLGLHARASAKLVTLAAKYQSEVLVRKDGREVSGKSIMGVLMLAAAQGTHITLVVKGEDAAEALEALAALIANRFDEEA
jgi:phosphocarrier protein HPr